MTTPLRRILDAQAAFNANVFQWGLQPPSDKGSDAILLQQLKEFATEVKEAVKESAQEE